MTQGRYGHDLDYDTNIFDDQKGFPEPSDAARRVNVAEEEV
ncbi:hypothetical protein Tco_0959077, partial [Tanacetum coccineum]